MAEKSERKRGVLARWREKRKQRRERRRPGAETRLRDARDRNLDSPGVSDTGAYGGPSF